MKHFVVTVVALFVFLASSYASDTIIVRKDPRLDVLTAKQAQINKRSSMMTSNGQYKGYRLQVLSTRSRDEAFKTKTDLLTRFPDEKAYLLYQSPYFRVRIGNFLKREDADKLRKQISSSFPNGCYVVEDAIDYIPPPDEDLITQ